MASETIQTAPEPVAAAVWPWRVSPNAKVNAGANRSRHALIQAIVMGAIAAVLWFWLEKRILGGIAAVLATLVLVGGLVYAPLYEGFQRFGGALGRGVGGALTWILLVPFFFVCFVPARVIQRLTGKDPMRRAFDRKMTSYWTPHHKPGGEAQYRKQY